MCWRSLELLPIALWSLELWDAHNKSGFALRMFVDGQTQKGSMFIMAQTCNILGPAEILCLEMHDNTSGQFIPYFASWIACFSPISYRCT